MNDRRDDGGGIHVLEWNWGGGRDAGRPGVPWFGVFLVVFGGLLLLQQVAPEFRAAGSLVVLAVGLAFLISWAARRRTSALYIGAIITAIALPSVLTDAGVISGDGWGTFALGIAFIAIALVRAASRGGWGWQLALGGLLTILGGSTVASHVSGFPEIGRYAWPIALVLIGVAFVLRGTARR
ncbi:MAG: hypothetical protein ACYDAK_03285 [Candidatus Limnocylindrales bacterium]